MSKKSQPLKAPSQQALQLVLDQAANAPLQNMQHAIAVDRALNEVRAFFDALNPDQSKSSPGVSGSPQASANSGGN